MNIKSIYENIFIRRIKIINRQWLCIFQISSLHISDREMTMKSICQWEKLSEYEAGSHASRGFDKPLLTHHFHISLNDAGGYFRL